MVWSKVGLNQMKQRLFHPLRSFRPIPVLNNGKRNTRQVKISVPVQTISVMLPYATLARQNYSLEKNKVELNRIDFIFNVRNVNKLVRDTLTL